MIDDARISSGTSAKGKALNMDAYQGVSIRTGIATCIPPMTIHGQDADAIGQAKDLEFTVFTQGKQG